MMSSAADHVVERLTSHIERMTEDYKYNLNVLEERDEEIRELEARLAGLQEDHCKLKAAVRVGRINEQQQQPRTPRTSPSRRVATPPRRTQHGDPAAAEMRSLREKIDEVLKRADTAPCAIAATQTSFTESDGHGRSRRNVSPPRQHPSILSTSASKRSSSARVEVVSPAAQRQQYTSRNGRAIPSPGRCEQYQQSGYISGGDAPAFAGSAAEQKLLAQVEKYRTRARAYAKRYKESQEETRRVRGELQDVYRQLRTLEVDRDSLLRISNRRRYEEVAQQQQQQQQPPAPLAACTPTTCCPCAATHSSQAAPAPQQVRGHSHGCGAPATTTSSDFNASGACGRGAAAAAASVAGTNESARPTETVPDAAEAGGGEADMTAAVPTAVGDSGATDQGASSTKAGARNTAPRRTARPPPQPPARHGLREKAKARIENSLGVAGQSVPGTVPLGGAHGLSMAAPQYSVFGSTARPTTSRSRSPAGGSHGKLKHAHTGWHHSGRRSASGDTVGHVHSSPAPGVRRMGAMAVRNYALQD